jgi:hypothetical protein
MVGLADSSTQRSPLPADEACRAGRRDVGGGERLSCAGAAAFVAI